jgi:prefoldin subunit 5
MTSLAFTQEKNTDHFLEQNNILQKKVDFLERKIDKLTKTIAINDATLSEINTLFTSQFKNNCQLQNHADLYRTIQ